MSSMRKELNELYEIVDDLVSGAYPQRSAMGPGQISKNFIKSKSISSHMLDVSELASITANTGSLNVTDDLIAGSGLNTLGYSPSNGLYIGNATPGSAPFRVTNAGAVTATNATVTGDVTATNLTASTAGTIAGWGISSSQLSTGTGSSTRGVSTGSIAFYAGNATPGSAPFRVTSGGAMTAESGSVGGWTINSDSLALGSGSTARGMSAGSTSFFAGSGTPGSAPFRVTSAGALTATNATITGAITATSGSFSGDITTNNIDANGGTLASLTVDGQLTMGTSGVIRAGAASSITSGTGIWIEYNSGTPRFRIGEAVSSGNDYLYWNGTSLTVSGRLEFGTGDYLENDLIHFEVGTTATNFIEIEGAGNAIVRGQAYAFTSNNTGAIDWHVQTGVDTAKMFASMSNTGGGVDLITIDNSIITSLSVNGNGTAAGSKVIIQLGDDSNAAAFFVQDNTGKTAFGAASGGILLTKVNDTTGGAGAYYGRIPVSYNYNGTPVTKYLRVYDS